MTVDLVGMTYISPAGITSTTIGVTGCAKVAPVKKAAKQKKKKGKR